MSYISEKSIVRALEMGGVAIDGYTQVEAKEGKFTAKICDENGFVLAYEEGTYIQSKWAVFAWQQTGVDAAAIVPVSKWNSVEEAAREMNRWKEAKEWANTAPSQPNKFESFNFQGSTEEKMAINTAAAKILEDAAGIFNDLISWDYEIMPEYRTETCKPVMYWNVSHITEIWE